MPVIEKKWVATVVAYSDNTVRCRFYHDNFYTLHKWVRREGFNEMCIDFDYTVTKNPLYTGV